MLLCDGACPRGNARRARPTRWATSLGPCSSNNQSEVARGLAAAEACGVVHRDLKPSNLMVQSDTSGELVVKIIDYGVAKVMAADPAVQTQAGFIGTPAFASRSRFNESGQQQVDTRSDIYSLGITFWYLLTAQMPFAGRSIEEVRAKQAQPLPLQQLKAARSRRMRGVVEINVSSRSVKPTANRARATDKASPVLSPVRPGRTSPTKTPGPWFSRGRAFTHTPPGRAY